MAKKHSALLMRTYVILVFCFMYLPIAVMIAFSFNESKSRSNLRASPSAGTKACSTTR